MRIRMLTTLAGDPGYHFGEVHDVPARVGRVWIAEGIAAVDESGGAGEDTVDDDAADVAAAGGAVESPEDLQLADVETAAAAPGAPRRGKK